MRGRICIQVMFAVALISVLAVSAMAADWTIKVNVPFAFQIGNHRMPAGSYTVSRYNNNDMLLINTGDGSSLFTNAIPSDPKANSDAVQLVFHVYGNSYYLSQVRVHGYAAELAPSKAEREALARLNAPVQTAVVTGR